VAQLTPFTPPPLVSQRSQRYRNDIGCVPDHEPLVVNNVFPSTGVPRTVGWFVAFGGLSAFAEVPPGTSSSVAAAPTRTPTPSERVGRRARVGAFRFIVNSPFGICWRRITM
jgi:hypothetical protein